MKRSAARELAAREEHARAFRALSHPHRLAVFFLLVRAAGEVTAGEIGKATGLPGPTLSHHLDLLRRAGLVRSRKEERYVHYSVERGMVVELVRLLTACC